MSKPTAAERRGTIILIILALIVLISMIFMRGQMYKSPFSETVISDSIATAPATDDSVRVIPADSLTNPHSIRHRKSKSKSTSKKHPSPEGRSRDYLSEPVPTR